MNRIYRASQKIKTYFSLLLFCFILFPAVSMASLSTQNDAATEPAKSGWGSVPQDAASKIQKSLNEEMCKFIKVEGKANSKVNVETASATTVDGQLSLSADTTATRFKSGDSWFALSLESFGRAGAMKKVNSPTMNTNGVKLSLERNGLTEWYINHGSNLEHGLILNEKPVGNGQLEFSFATSGTLTPRQNGKDIFFVGGNTMNYAGIKSWDSAGTELVCSMSVKDGALIWSVDDSKAKYPVTIDPTISIARKLTARTDADVDDTEVDARFGQAVSVSGDIVIVGADRKKVFASIQAGAAYIFYKNQGGANNWGIVKKIVATKDDGSGDFDGNASDFFGKSVSVSGDYVIVGAPRDDDLVNAGTSYIYSRYQGGVDNWGIVRRITAGTDIEADGYFGEAVALAGDIALVGAYGKNDGVLNDVGAAYVFTKDQGGGDNWGMVKKIIATKDDGSGSSDAEDSAEFGLSVSLSGDIAIVGARKKNESGKGDAGAVYIYSKDQGGDSNWGIVKKNIARTDTDADDTELNGYFGHSVSVSGYQALVGAYGRDENGKADAGAAYIYFRDQGGPDKWGIVKKLTAQNNATSDDIEADARFGYSVSIGDNLALVSAYRKDEPGLKSGAAYMFSKDQGGSNRWGIEKKFTAEKTDGTSDIEAGALFGWNVSLSEGVAVLGAYAKIEEGKAKAGAAYVYNVSRAATGCVMNPQAGLSFELLLLALMPLVGILRRRFK